jgi:exopolyphosphatase/guanosine-5'-triphosphate,3'-diphosphate pyrophosphatase
MRQLLALRLAVILAHAHRDPKLEGVRLQEASSGLQLLLPAGWSSAFPQSMHLLAEEALAWQKTPCPLEVIEP